MTPANQQKELLGSLLSDESLTLLGGSRSDSFDLETAINIAGWWDVPKEKRRRDL